jgi:hypothetical protein
MNKKLLQSNIIETLNKNGALDIDTLFKSVKKFQNNMDKRVLEDKLMVLELHGLLKVYKMARGKTRVELAKG